ncbi:nuclear matrix protein [Karstenula rhodostoma CBS 690.94]|uniref:Nuclear matrix protein n=1 Tax=Karstenula rhodostoma CBS 690.94 TaxID=1392251 RepID=A0A9P4UBZ0_9PLEO|nr:nuclear matrix protein [Karstenula rhodostoma CBS 690.94]
MAIPAMSSEDILSSRLDALVRRARTVKQETSIDPPLQISALLEDNEAIVERIEPRDLRELTAESSAKSILYPILSSARISDPSFVDVWNLLDIVQGCADRDLCSNQLVLLLAEEVLDSLSIADCHVAFNYLESRREAILSGGTGTTGSKEMVILRTCNELLRRLSRAEDPVFCGRVYVFLFQSFPLGHKGSVNLRGEFHVGNVTTFEDWIVSEQADDLVMEDAPNAGQIESVKGGVKAEETKPTESDSRVEKKPTTLDLATLYPVFWSLQHSFSNPPQLFDNEKFKHFQDALEATLAKFKEVDKVIQSGESARKAGSPATANDSYDEFANAFNPKYLTSRDLFKLELSDVAFQRHVLVQALILIDFLLTLTGTAKSKPHYENAQQSMKYNFTLSDENTEWALGIKTAIANYLQDGPDGKFYYRVVDTVLSRDKNWVRWKMDRCQSFTRQKVPAKIFLDSKGGAIAAVTSKKDRKPAGVPPALRFLATAEPGKGLAQLRQRGKFIKPSPQEYTARIETTDQEPPTEEDPRGLDEKITSSTWRGLRLASQDQLSLFDRFNHANGLKSLFQPGQTRLEDKGSDPQPEQSVEEPRADQQGIVA